MMKYDTVEGITAYLTDLAGLHRLFSDRRRAFYDHQEHLSSFIILGRWATDSCGNHGRAVIGTYSGGDATWIADDLPPVVPMSDLHLFKSLNITTTYEGPPPHPHSICPECNAGWTMETSHDFVRLETRKPPSKEEFGDWEGGFEHAYCHKLSGEREVKKEFQGYLEKAGLGRALLTMIPNEYWKDAAAKPWCLARTAFGTLKIGWRKRVLSIDWSAVYDDRLARIEKKLELEERYWARQSLREAFDGKTLFPNDDVTRWETGVHAWGAEKAVEYLAVLREKVLREPAQAIASLKKTRT